MCNKSKNYVDDILRRRRTILFHIRYDFDIFGLVVVKNFSTIENNREHPIVLLTLFWNTENPFFIRTTIRYV